MRQFEVRWANLPEPIGRRLVLLLSRTQAYAYLNKVIVAEVTSVIRRIPQEVVLGREDGLSRESVVNMDNIHVVPKAVLGEPMGSLSAEKTQIVKRALGYALDWPELKVL